MAKKMSFDKDKLKTFFILHSEKIVCVLFIAFMVMLCWKAYGLEMYKQTPQQLAEKTAAANELLASSKFDPVANNVVVLDYPVAVNQRRGTILADRYSTIAWCPPVHLYKVRRTEPAFFPLEELVADTGYGAIAYGGEGGGEEVAPGNAAGMVRGVRVPANAQIRGEYWVAIRGLIPVGRQELEYERVFSNAMHRDPAKDVPEYTEVTKVIIQRAEVSSGASVDEKDWVTIKIKDALNSTMFKWATTFPEIADPALIDPTLCEPLPPLVGKNFDPTTVTHPPQIGVFVKKEGDEEAPKKPAAPTDDEGRAKGFGGSKRAPPKVAQPGQNAEENRTKKRIAHRLFRFFDFTVVPGKVYRYRVQLALYNPNFGIDPRYLKTVKQGEASVGDGEERQTPWSQPSNAVTLPRNYEIFAGPVYKPKSDLKEVQATLMVRQWDAEQAVDAVHEFNKEVARPDPREVRPEVQRGTLLNITTPVLVDRPGSTAPQTQEVTFQTDELLVDLSGAEFMPGPSGPGVPNSKRIKAPSEMLFLQANGELAIREMASEAKDYARLTHEISAMHDRKAGQTPPPPKGSILDPPKKSILFDLDSKKPK